MFLETRDWKAAPETLTLGGKLPIDSCPSSLLKKSTHGLRLQRWEHQTGSKLVLKSVWQGISSKNVDNVESIFSTPLLSKLKFVFKKAL